VSHANSAMDQVAIVGVGTTEYTRHSTNRSSSSFILEACVNAIKDSGLSRDDIDGICASGSLSAYKVQSALGIPEITWWDNTSVPTSFLLIEAMNAILSGSATAVLVCHGVYRNPSLSRSAASDPFRVRTVELAPRGTNDPESIFGAVGYAAWTSQYLHQFPHTSREDLGLIAVNNRSNAALNDHAVMRDPITLDDYLAARMIREPLCILDMDIPIDGADAFVVTSAKRAADLPNTPVLIHAATAGQTKHPEEDSTISIFNTGQNVVMKSLWDKSDLKLSDMDIFFPYDGFSTIALNWFENVGYCARGEAGDFIRSNWNADRQRIEIDGRILVNTHGGSLSEGGTQGSGHLREAAVQLRGEAGERQAPGIKTALLVPGGFFFNASGLVFRVE
jgi:acetyl-CoA acetyltransferase